MEYQHIVLENEAYGSDTAILQRRRSPPRPGSSFLVARKSGKNPSRSPTTIATFVIKRRGPFSDELYSLQKGDEVYIRGLYGQGFDPRKQKSPADGAARA